MIVFLKIAYFRRLRWYLSYFFIARTRNYTKRAQRTGKGIQGVFQKCFTVIFCCACAVMRSFLVMIRNNGTCTDVRSFIKIMKLNG